MTHLATGQWQVALPGLATPGPRDGSIQVTPVSVDVGAHCSVPSWSSGASGQTITVFCFSFTGAPFDTRFELTYQFRTTLFGSAFPPKYFGYLWWAPGPGPATTNFNSQGGVNVASPSATGLYSIKFPMLAQTPDTVQITAASGGTPNWCVLTDPWTHLGADTVVQNVSCYTVGGAPVNNGWIASLNSQF